MSTETDRTTAPAEPDRIRDIAVNRTTLRVWEWGNPDDPAVICAHGAFDHGRMFDDLAPRVAARGMRVLCPDLRGHGRSGRIMSGHTFGASIVDLACLAKLHGTAGLIGHSMGGSMSLQAAAAFPDLFRWAIVFDGLGPPASMFAERDLKTHATQSVEYAIKTLGRDRRIFESVEAMAAQRGAINTRIPPAWLDHLARHGSEPNGDGFSWLWDPKFNVGFPDGFRIEWVVGDYDRVTCPALVLMAGTDDMWSDMPDDEARERCAMMADARLHFIDDGGHYLHLERPDHVAGLVLDFIEEVGP